MNNFKHIAWMVAVLVCLVFPTIGNCEYYEVKLRNSRIIKVKQYYEKDDTIFLLRYGNYVGIDKNEVLEIVRIQDPSGPAEAAPPRRSSAGPKASSSQLKSSPRASRPQASTSSQGGSGTKATPSRKASRDVVKNSVAPFKRLASGGTKTN